MSLWFVAGMLAAVNPCGFVLLPTYLAYFLGISNGEGAEPVPQRVALRRALKVSAALAGGFMVVFVIAAGLANYFTNWLTANAKYATGFFGVVLIVLGVAMLFGYKLPFMTPKIGQGQKDQTIRSMFVYGMAYAIASLGCTIGFFISAVFATSRRGGAWDGITNGLAYAMGMTLIVGGLTVALAFTNNSLLKFLRRGLQYMDRVAAAFVLISGFYLLWYFYWVDLREEGSAITDWVESVQAGHPDLHQRPPVGGHRRAVLAVPRHHLVRVPAVVEGAGRHHNCRTGGRIDLRQRPHRRAHHRGHLPLRLGYSG